MASESSRMKQKDLAHVLTGWNSSNLNPNLQDDLCISWGLSLWFKLLVLFLQGESWSARGLVQFHFAMSSSQQLTLWEDNSNSRQSVTESMDQSWSYTSLLKNYILEGILAGTKGTWKIQYLSGFSGWVLYLFETCWNCAYSCKQVLQSLADCQIFCNSF